MEQIFTIHKTQKIIKKKRSVWMWEGQDGNNAESTSRNKAVRNFIRNHPRKRYEFTLPNGLKCVLQENNGRWLFIVGNKVMPRTSLTKATNSFLNSDYLIGVESLQIAISEGKEE